MKKITLSIMLFVCAFFLTAQQTTESATENFKKYLDGSLYLPYAEKSLPSLAECKLIFKGTNADSVYAFVVKMKNSMGGGKAEKFVDVRVESFTTEDVVANTPGKAYTGGMSDIAGKLQPNITFYKVSYLRTPGAERGMAYNYWVYVNKRWVFVPKPWRAFGG